MLEALRIDSVADFDFPGYEWVSGVATFAVDPTAPANQRIVDLDLVRPDGDGLVRLESDVRILRPSGDGNGRALVVVPNRGMTGGVPFSAGAPFAFSAAAPDPGDGFLLHEGWTIGWCGWQWDVRREDGWLGLDAPFAPVDPGWMRVEFRPDVDQPTHRLSDSSLFFTFADYPVAQPDDLDATLRVRTSPMDRGVVISRDAWRFPDDAEVELDGGFKAFHWYELLYRSCHAPVVGTGLLATRDFGAWLRQSHPQVVAYGVSQSGRLLREFLFEGLNVDENGLPVFDGVMAHIASARRGEFNCRYGQPSLTHPLTPSYGPPYTNAGLLDRQRRLGGVPKIVSTNSSWEYWRGDGALLHQEPVTGADLVEEPNERLYLLAGSDHMGATPMKEYMPVANPPNLIDTGPLLRAAFANLARWVADGTEPPPSVVPRRSDGTAVERELVLDHFRRTRGGTALPDPRQLPWTPDLDPTSTEWPLERGPRRVALVADVDAGGNERGGIRLPCIDAAVAAYTGWNPRRPEPGLPDVLYEFVGSALPAPDEQLPTDRAECEHLARASAEALVSNRHLLEQDIERTVDEALRLYDMAVSEKVGGRS